METYIIVGLVALIGGIALLAEIITNKEEAAKQNKEEEKITPEVAESLARAESIKKKEVEPVKEEVVKKAVKKVAKKAAKKTAKRNRNLRKE